ncbi:MAG: hypothetical protein JXR64_04120 [Spirochaetales bacterium]|nr:hypothetical protein [Spirochaetales bacterium]
MAVNTDITLRNKLVYQVFSRQHNSTGTFKEFIKDLDRIKDLGTDYIYFLPIHEIGQFRKKGDLGCPYSIKDYYSVNHEYGTLQDFKELVSEIHKRDMKVIIDIVFNHTSHDSVMLNNYSHLYYKNEKGELSNRIGDWWDITDLDYSKKELYPVMFDILKYWANQGLDGFRCDVASFLPKDFWIEARAEIAKINSKFIWIAESVHASGVKELRDAGFGALSDSEVYEAFDICYDYDIHHHYLGYFKGENNLQTYLDSIMFQESIYPQNYVKLRFLENHDQPRVASLVNNFDKLLNFTAFNLFLKGTSMVYAGQEAQASHHPDLFNTDKVDWSKLDESREISAIINKIITLKKEDSIFVNGKFNIRKMYIDGLVHITYENEKKTIHGFFNLKGVDGYLKLNVPELEHELYKNILTGENVQIFQGNMPIYKKPVILTILK